MECRGSLEGYCGGSSEVECGGSLEVEYGGSSWELFQGPLRIYFCVLACRGAEEVMVKCRGNLFL